MLARMTTDPIDVAAVLASVGSPADGAVLLFVGTVRDENDGRSVRGMRYESYAAMAEPVLAEIAGGIAAGGQRPDGRRPPCRVSCRSARSVWRLR
jgi:molybdopterin synthase catalytic subunit